MNKPDLPALLKDCYEWLLLERDSFYENTTDSEGEFIGQYADEERETLQEMDAMLDRLKAAREYLDERCYFCEQVDCICDEGAP